MIYLGWFRGALVMGGYVTGGGGGATAGTNAGAAGLKFFAFGLSDFFFCLSPFSSTTGFLSPSAAGVGTALVVGEEVVEDAVGRWGLSRFILGGVIPRAILVGRELGEMYFKLNSFN